MWLVAGALLIICIVLAVIITVQKRSLLEILSELDSLIAEDTNNLITVSTHSKALRRFAIELNKQLRLLKQERLLMQNGNAEIKEAVTNISHDLRTPLTAINGYLDLMEREEKSPEMSRYLSIIRERTENMKSLTEELFRYSVTVSGENETELAEICINSVLEESIAGYFAALTQRNITPQIIMPEDEVWCTADKKAMLRIFGNLISNAIKYSDGDLRIALNKNGVIEFQNTAEGLNKVSAERLFDRFYTVETGRNSTGLGLSIAKVLTEQLGGSISASYSGQTLTVSLSFLPAN